MMIHKHTRECVERKKNGQREGENIPQQQPASNHCQWKIPKTVLIAIAGVFFFLLLLLIRLSFLFAFRHFYRVSVGVRVPLLRTAKL